MKRFASFATMMCLISVTMVPGRIAAQAAQANGVISGAASADGKPVRNTTARLRMIDTGELAGTSVTDSAGIFAFVNLRPATYVIELVCNGRVLMGTSAPITITPDAPQSRGITVEINTVAALTAGATACVGPASKASEILKSMGQPFTSALGIVVVGAAAASGVTGIVAVKNDTSASR